MRNSPSHHKQCGLSLVELMIALTIGLLLLTGLSLIFVNSSQANRELQKTAQQIENGRYAIDIVSQDLRHTGYYGHFYQLPDPPAALPLPDPCETASTTNLHAALALPIQGYRAPNLNTAPDVSTTTCALLTAANLKVGSDIVVVRRADTNALAATATATTNEVYIQATSLQAEVQKGNGAVVGNNKASGGASTLLKKDGTPAPIRKYHVHVYFVAPCSVGSGTNGACQAGDDAIPTLKRLELTSVAGTTIMRLSPLVEGIEYLKIEYGIDNFPATANGQTGLIGDATVDTYLAAPGVGDWPQVIAANVYVLARNVEQTAGFTDDKTYTLGAAAVPAFNDRFRRHVYTAALRMANSAGRREIPPS
jgi:type IV pilus assembly protein PilW